MIAGIQEILELLPHRPPFVFVDGVELKTRHRHIKAWKLITANEVFMPGHFPSEYIMPGVLITEFLAQAASLLVGLSVILDHKDGIETPVPTAAYLARINLKIQGKAVPGDRLEAKVVLEQKRSDLFTFRVEAAVDRRAIVSGTLTLVFHFDDSGDHPLASM